MKPEELLEHPEFATLYDSPEGLWADIEIKTPGGNIYCISWRYRDGAIRDPKSYDLDHINKVRGDDLIPSTTRELGDDLGQYDFGLDVLDTLLTIKLRNGRPPV